MSLCMSLNLMMSKHEKYLIKKVTDLMKKKFCQSVDTEDRDGVSISTFDGSF